MRRDSPPDWFPGFAPGTIRWGLERIEELLAGVENPHRRFRSAHIGGTNGKGSVAALCDAALRASGRFRVGLYTSPHLVSFGERIRIDGVPSGPDVLADAAARLRPAVERTGASFFEATTALAFLCFAEAEVDIAVVEVGLGGRLDATNVLAPVATAITNVGHDHGEYLGSKLQEIAREKAGILKPAVPAVTAATQPEVLQVLREQAESVGAPLVALDEVSSIGSVETDPAGVAVGFQSDVWGERRLQIGLRGTHQARNALLAAEFLARLPAPFRPEWDVLAHGFAGVRWPGRLQVEQVRGTTWVFDVAHNPDGAEALAASLEALDLPRPIVLLTAVLADKDWSAMLDTLAPRVDGFVLTLAPSSPQDRRWDLDLAAEYVERSACRQPRPIPDFSAAIDRAATLAPHGTVVVTGSVYTVGDAMQLLGISPF